MPDLAVWPTDGADGSVASEARWRKMARLWAPPGCTVGGLVPTLVAGPSITVTPGSAWLDGHFAELTTGATVPVSANGLLVLRFTPADNRCELLYRDGAAAPTQTDPTWELPLAKMTAGAMADLRFGIATAGAPLVGSLPVFPFDGQEVNLVLPALNVIWRLVYYSGLPAPYRWACIGAAPLNAIVGANENMAVSATPIDLPTPGPQITLPMAGYYLLSCGFNANNMGAASVQTAHALAMPAATATGSAAVSSNPGAAAASNVTVGSPDVTIGPYPAGQIIRLRYTATGSAGYFGGRWLTVLPLRLAG